MTTATASGRRWACMGTEFCRRSVIRNQSSEDQSSEDQSCCRQLAGLREDEIDVLQLVLGGRNIEDKGLEAALDVFRDLRRDALIAPDQIRAKSFVVFKRPEPIRRVVSSGRDGHVRKLLVPC